MDKFEYFTAFLADIAKTSPQHKDLLESVKTGVKLILEAEGDSFAGILSNIPEFLKNASIDEDPEVLATRFINKYADKSVDAMSEDEYNELMDIIEETIKETLNAPTSMNEAEGDVVPTEGRKIRVFVEEWDEESKDIGETDEKYWEEETGVSMEPDEFDIDDGKTAVDLAVSYLKDNGPVESDHEGKIYRTIDAPMTRDRIERGIDEFRTFFLDNFSDEELEQIKAKV